MLGDIRMRWVVVGGLGYTRRPTGMEALSDGLGQLTAAWDLAPGS